MPRQLSLIRLKSIPADRGIRVCTEGLDLAVFRDGDAVYALEDSCPHQGASLSAGRLQGHVVNCPAHGLKFNVTTGCAVASPTLRNKTYPVHVVDGTVVLEIK
ncbi:Rieske (2Fe-2S) protein [Cupriavidus basilensis]